jgi:hypothetical protein
MDWLTPVNRFLVRRIGYELTRPPSRGRRKPLLPRGPADRLLEQPAFILSPVRSGSTLLRVILDSHPEIHSPHELHLRRITVEVKEEGHAAKSLRDLGLDKTRLEYMLWDRVLHRSLTEAHKPIVVNKTPNDLFIIDRIAECWPDARFIYLIRHPGAIARSRHKARPQDTPERNARVVRRYCRALNQARKAHPGLTVRYEDLTAEPERVTQEICEFLGVEWDPKMLDYGRFSHGVFRPGLGDWSPSIKSGEIRPPGPLPTAEETPELLHKHARKWGYLERRGKGPQERTGTPVDAG